MPDRHPRRIGKGNKHQSIYCGFQTETGGTNFNGKDDLMGKKNHREDQKTPQKKARNLGKASFPFYHNIFIFSCISCGLVYSSFIICSFFFTAFIEVIFWQFGEVENLSDIPQWNPAIALTHKESRCNIYKVQICVIFEKSNSCGTLPPRTSFVIPHLPTPSLVYSFH